MSNEQGWLDDRGRNEGTYFEEGLIGWVILQFGQFQAGQGMIDAVIRILFEFFFLPLEKTKIDGWRHDVSCTYVEKKTFADQTFAEILFVDGEFQELKEGLLELIDIFDVAHH